MWIKREINGKYEQNVSESENKELWNNAYTLTLVPKWVKGFMWIKEGCESIEGDLTEVSLYSSIVIKSRINSKGKRIIYLRTVENKTNY